ncbi:tetratricopeptide repeat protein [Prochlorothrix hollandica]|uniref:tetratricopeptide repeat protein n=1 Tax=Prochlorothrix hollandica TaxID=1223 RepID=UPI0003452D74|nr:tetratricopeptide repeat protein [Prochlorothrix hollandica]
MTGTRKRWLINGFLIVALVSFVGISIAPLLNSLVQNNPTPAVSPQATPGSPATPGLSDTEKTALEDQAKGYELVLQREPENTTALKGLLETRLRLGDIAGAIVPLEKLAEFNPEQTEYTVLLAQAKQQVGDREGAADAYRTILTAKPGDLAALQGLVALLLQEERPEAALGLLQDTLKLAEQATAEGVGAMDVASIRLILGQVYAEQQRYDEAIAIYDEISLLNTTDFRPILAKALVLRTQGQEDLAKPLFEESAALAPAQYKDQIKQLIEESAPPIPSVDPNVPAIDPLDPSTPETPETPETPDLEAGSSDTPAGDPEPTN